MDKDRIKLLKWVSKTTIINVLLMIVCFGGILSIMLHSYGGGTDISEDVIGEWDCIQFYKNQKSFQVPDSQEVIVAIESNGKITLTGSANASIFRGATREGNYTIEGGSTLLVDMGDEMWTCSCVFTKDGLLRMTISEAEVVLYLKER
ncbi:MAG: hypothetical protein IKJ01_03370 [Lachnospiraceae bacterium]|nr:hypothetical protein [Lachnospiraceae bacterium]